MNPGPAGRRRAEDQPFPAPARRGLFETLIQELDKFGPEDRIGIVSLMDHTPRARQFRDLSKLKDYYVGKHGISDADWETHVASQRALKDRFGEVHEAAAVAAARRYGAVLASHDDTEARHVARSAEHGAQFAEFPTTVEAAQACTDHGIKVMMGAPNLIRGAAIPATSQRASWRRPTFWTSCRPITSLHPSSRRH